MIVYSHYDNVIKRNKGPYIYIYIWHSFWRGSNSTVSCSELVGSIRYGTITPAMVDELCFHTFITCSSNGNMQWVEMIGPWVSLLGIGGLLFIIIHIFVSIKRMTLNLKEGIHRIETKGSNEKAKY